MISVLETGFWNEAQTWKRAAKNTLNCLIGCSIGDFGMLTYLQIYWPELPIFTRMLMAMASGLATSIIFEAIILKRREKFAWREAFRVAIGMSFISMLGMEIAENATDWFLTGGMVPASDPWYWIAILISLAVGFAAPLPYNYYKLHKHGKSCHGTNE